MSETVSRGTPLEQLIDEIQAESRARMKRPTITVVYQDEPMSLRELSQRVGISHSAITRRYRLGMRFPELIGPVDETRTRRGKWE